MPREKLSYAERVDAGLDLDARYSRREKAFDRAWDRREKLEVKAKPLVGELQGEKGHRYYINKRFKDGRFTGQIVEFPMEWQAIDYLIRNHYV